MPRPRPSDLGGRSVSYSILRITDHYGRVAYEAVETRSVRDREKAYQDAYLRAAREWKPGADPSNPLQQPRKPEVRVWRNVMGGAEAWDRAHAVVEECRKKELKNTANGPGKRDAQPDTEGDKPSLPPALAPVDSRTAVPGPLVK